MSTFDELLDGPVLKTAKRLYKQPTEIQQKVIPVVLAKHDVVAMSKTGSGKTASFLMPIIQLLQEHSKITGARALILSPTRELSLQTARFFREYSTNTTLKAASLIGGEPLPPQFDALTTNPDVLIATPGRLLHIIAETQYSLSRIQFIVFDEADQMFELGMEEQLSAILQIVPNKHQSLLFSATIPELLVHFTQVNLNNAIVVRIDPSELPDTLGLTFRLIAPPFKPALLLTTVRQYSNALIFVGTKHHAEFLAALLVDLGLKAGCIYGDMDQDERSSSLAKFTKGAIKALFVTDVAARGLDIEGLDLVINYDFPAKPKIFLHRSGRAGRAGRHGSVISFVTQEELPYYCGAKQSLNGYEWVLSRVAREEIDNQIIMIDDAVGRSADLQTLQKSMKNGEQMYVKSRPVAKPMWLSLAKEEEENIKDSSNTTENIIRNWRPRATIFEQAPKNQKQVDLMLSLRNAHKGHVKQKTEENVKPPSKAETKTSEVKETKPAEPAPVSKRKVREAKPKQEKKPKTNKFFIEYIPEGHDANQIKDMNVSSLMDKVLEITPDDRSGIIQQQKARKLGKSSKKEKLARQIATGNQTLIRNAVAQLEGVNPKGEKYQAWVEQSNKHIQEAGQEEKIIKDKRGKKGSGRLNKKQKGVKNEIKSAEEIEREKLIKMKHKLNDQKKHKEAAALNKQIYKHKKKGKK